MRIFRSRKKDLFIEAIESNRAVHFENYFRSLDLWYEISAYPNGDGLSVYFKDVTGRKLSEIQLVELNRSLEKHARELAISNAELEQFAYVASHDLQEPLRMVTGFLTQLEKKYTGLLDEKGKQYIHFAVDGAKRMRNIILDLLEFSRVGHMEGIAEQIDITKLLNDIMILYSKQIGESNAIIDYQDMPVIDSHKVGLSHVFQNLIGNSLKYVADGVSPIIRVRFKDDGAYWQFSIQDNGIGIDAEYFEKFFIIFQRLHNKDTYSGTGMGLAITKKIVENLGGMIWVESETEKGSTFYFTIKKNLQ